MTDVYTNGIDVSHYNGVVDWKKVADSGIAFAYVKATEGTQTKDPQFSANYAGVKDNGLLRGAYHFFHPSLDAKAQSANFLQLVSILGAGDLPPALDVEIAENQNASTIAKGVQQWLDLVETALGRTPIIYTGASFWNANVGKTGNFAKYPLWVAHYTSKPSPNIPSAFTDYTLWQYSESGSVAGITGTTDLNRFKGGLDGLKGLAGG